jgi:threonine 3-dehydrogenase
VGEKFPEKALLVNNKGTENVFELARRHDVMVFCPSTIGAFGPSTPSVNTPDDTIMRPVLIYIGAQLVWFEPLFIGFYPLV